MNSTPAEKENEGIVYALIAREDQVLCEYTAATGNFSQYIRLLLPKISGADERKSFMAKEEGYAFHYEVKDGLTYLCLADLKFDRMPCFRYLTNIRQRFLSTYGERWKTAIAFSFNADFRTQLQKQMIVANSDVGNSKIDQISESLDNVRGVMVENIEKVLDRGEHLELLVKKSEDLHDTTYDFKQKSITLRNQMWWQKTKMTLLIVFICALVLYIILAMACGGFALKGC